MDTLITMNEPVTNDASKGVVGHYIRMADGDILAAYERFKKDANARIDGSKIPNAQYGTANDLFASLLTIYDTKKRIDGLKDILTDRVYNNLIYDTAMQANSLLGDVVIEFPDIENISVEEEVMEYEQSLIKLYNKLPNIRDDKKREDLLWMSNVINSTIEQARTMRGMEEM